MTDSKDTDQAPTLEEIKDEELDRLSGGAVNSLSNPGEPTRFSKA